MDTNHQQTSPSSTRVQQTRNRILEAAAKTFAAHGYSGSTTRSIADSAGVSELTLFRHFHTKKNLFMQVVENYSALPEMARRMPEGLSGDLRQDLIWMGRFFLEAILERRAAILMTLNEAERFPEIRNASQHLLSRQRALLANYLRSQMKNTRIKKGEPEMLAQSFMGMFFAYAVQRSLFEQAPPSDQEVDDIVELFVSIFLEGAAVAENLEP